MRCHVHCRELSEVLFAFAISLNLVSWFWMNFSKTPDLQQRERGTTVGKSQFQVYGTVVLSQHMVEPIDSSKQFDKVHSFVSICSFGLFIIHVIGFHNNLLYDLVPCPCILPKFAPCGTAAVCRLTTMHIQTNIDLYLLKLLPLMLL